MGFEDKINSAFSRGIDKYMIAVHFVKDKGKDKEENRTVQKDTVKETNNEEQELV